MGALKIYFRRSPGAKRPYRARGYSYVPALFLLVTAYLLVNTLLATPLRALAGIGLIIIGMPVYEYFNRRSGELEPLNWLQSDEPNS